MTFKHWLGSILIGTGLGLYIFVFLITQNFLTSSHKAFVITSGSMAPKVPLGSVVLTQTKPNYQVGDIITFQDKDNQENVLTHRIYSIDNQVLTTKGDANEDPDRLTILPDQIIGKVIFTVPYLGYLVDFAKTPKGFVAMIVIPATIIIYEELKTLLKEVMSHLRKISKGGGVPLGKNQPRALIILPLFGFIFLFITSAGAFFSDQEKLLGNTLGAAASFDQNVTLFFESSDLDLDLNLDPKSQSIAFVRATFKFDPALLALTEEITPTTELATVVEKTTTSQANSTGIIILVLALTPGDPAPTTTFTLAHLKFAPLTSTPNQTASLNFDSADIQIINLATEQLTPQLNSITLTLNTTP